MADQSYLIRVTAKILNVRCKPGTSFQIVSNIRNGEVLTIVDQTKVHGTTWGQLKGGTGWINLRHTEPVNIK